MPTTRKYFGWVRLGSVWHCVIQSYEHSLDNRAARKSCRDWLKANRRKWRSRGLVSICVLSEGLDPKGPWREW